MSHFMEATFAADTTDNMFEQLLERLWNEAQVFVRVDGDNAFTIMTNDPHRLKQAREIVVNPDLDPEEDEGIE